MGSVPFSVVAAGFVLAFIALLWAGVWLMVPILVVVFLIVVAGPILRFIAERGGPGSDEPAVPSTREASYEPVEPRPPTE